MMLSFNDDSHVFDNNWLKINQLKNLIAKDFKQIEIRSHALVNTSITICLFELHKFTV